MTLPCKPTVYELSDHGVQSCGGAPLYLFILSFQNSNIHRAAGANTKTKFFYNVPRSIICFVFHMKFL